MFADLLRLSSPRNHLKDNENLNPTRPSEHHVSPPVESSQILLSSPLRVSLSIGNTYCSFELPADPVVWSTLGWLEVDYQPIKTDTYH